MKKYVGKIFCKYCNKWHNLSRGCPYDIPIQITIPLGDIIQLTTINLRKVEEYKTSVFENKNYTNETKKDILFKLEEAKNIAIEEAKKVESKWDAELERIEKKNAKKNRKEKSKKGI